MNRLAFVTLTVLLCVYPAYEWIDQPRDPIFFARGAGFVVLALISIWMSISAIVRRMHDVGSLRLVVVESAGAGCKRDNTTGVVCLVRQLP